MRTWCTALHMNHLQQQHQNQKHRRSKIIFKFGSRQWWKRKFRKWWGGGHFSSVPSSSDNSAGHPAKCLPLRWTRGQNIQASLEAVQKFVDQKVCLQAPPFLTRDAIDLYFTTVIAKKPSHHWMLSSHTSIFCRYQWACRFQSKVSGGVQWSQTTSRCPEISVCTNYSTEISWHAPWSANQHHVSRRWTQVH